MWSTYFSSVFLLLDNIANPSNMPEQHKRENFKGNVLSTCILFSDSSYAYCKLHFWSHESSNIHIMYEKKNLTAKELLKF